MGEDLWFLRETFEVKTAEPFAVMAKPVGSRCNVNCGYCYYLDADSRGENARMSDALLETFIRGYIEASPGPVVSFTWHGGEPTLAGLDFFRLAVELQKRYLPEGFKIWNNLQTNGTLLDDEWAAFLAGNRFDVGLSVDGTRELHDRYRKDSGGGATYDRAVAAVRLLQNRGIQPDLLCTVTSATAREPLAVYRSLRQLGTGWIQFIPIVRRTGGGELSPESVGGEEYGRFLCEIFDEWLLNDIGKTEVQLFAETAMVRSGRAASLCWMAPTCGRVLIVERDGGVYACDHYVTPERRLGDIAASGLGALVDSPEQRRFGDDKRGTLPRQCRECESLALCNGGCPKDRLSASTDGEPGLNVLCAGLKRFFVHSEAPMKRAMALRRRGLGPDAIMAQLRG
ncbi:MAG: anaerobic sulfatase maturase [Treponema sp.]|nr:anaerobic sulfatase maturase [Treponema sp.]